MNILGISGFENAEPFKRATSPGLAEREYRICQGYDAAAALVVDGVTVAAAAEERFDGRKHSPNFPVYAIRYCLSQAGLELDDIDEIVHSFDYAPHESAYSLDPLSKNRYCEVFSRNALLNQVSRELGKVPAQRVKHTPHHLAHAASAYYTSGWDNCLVIVVDGLGETQSASVFLACDGSLKLLHETAALDSIGILYSLITLHLGFEFNSDEYKIMGLAPYGDPSRRRSFFEAAVQLLPNGTVRIPALRMNRDRSERESYAGTRRYFEENLIPSRDPGQAITAEHQDVAAALQESLDRALLHICGHWGKITGRKRLALAGGVALNCTANGRLLRSGLFDEIYIQPAAGDDGSALGAALYRAAEAGEACNLRSPVPFWGPSPKRGDVDTALAEAAGQITWKRFESLEDACADAAAFIADGRVIAWCRGRMEFGPRALGNRSILADPSHPEMRDRINAMVKKREAFRPFAPAVTLEEAPRWFEVAAGEEHPYMITTVDVQRQHRAALPAITHVNGSARVQTVSQSGNPEFHTLLRAVGRATGRELVLNTSFNVKGQPMVNSPREAICTFLGTGIDFLFLENVLITRRGPTA